MGAPPRYHAILTGTWGIDIITTRNMKDMKEKLKAYQENDFIAMIKGGKQIYISTRKINWHQVAEDKK